MKPTFEKELEGKEESFESGEGYFYVCEDIKLARDKALQEAEKEALKWEEKMLKYFAVEGDETKGVKLIKNFKEIYKRHFG
jgi:hypothetical protein